MPLNCRFEKHKNSQSYITYILPRFFQIFTDENPVALTLLLYRETLEFPSCWHTLSLTLLDVTSMVPSKQYFLCKFLPDHHSWKKSHFFLCYKLHLHLRYGMQQLVLKVMIMYLNSFAPCSFTRCSRLMNSTLQTVQSLRYIHTHLYMYTAYTLIVS